MTQSEVQQGPSHNDADSLVALGFDADILELLRKHGIFTLTALVEKQESAVCRLLLEDDYGMGMSNDLASAAVARFKRLRDHMDGLGRSFAGERHELFYLFVNAF